MIVMNHQSSIIEMASIIKPTKEEYDYEHINNEYDKGTTPNGKTNDKSVIYHLSFII